MKLSTALLLILLLFTPGTARAAAGDLDTTFGEGGVALAEVGDEGARALLLLPDEKLLTATTADADATSTSLLLTRYTASGDIDGTFGSGGTATITLAADKLSEVHAMVRQNDGKLLIAGRGLDAFTVVRATGAGALDGAYGSGGAASASTGGDDEAFAIAVDGDGKAVVAGRSDTGSTSDFAIARFTLGGAADGTFSGDGKTSTDLGGDDEARGLVVQGDGKILVVGTSNAGDGELALVRYTATGALDNDFGSGGKVITHVTSSDDVATSVVVLTDGRILVAGSAGDDFVLARYSGGGVLDPGFGNGGVAVIDVSPGEIDGAAALVRQGDGKLIAGGVAHGGVSDDFAVVRRNSGGGNDASFGDGGKAVTDVHATMNESIRSLVLLPDGRLLAAGLAEDGRTDYQMIARYITSTVVVCGDGAVGGSELCDDGDTSWVAGEFCRADCTRLSCGKPTDSAGSKPTASDALFTLKAAVGSASCDVEVCDTDSAGTVTAGDALRILKAAVGQAVALTCPS